MTIEEVLTDVDVGDLYQDWLCFFKDNPGSAALCIRAIEQAVLQSEQVQALRKDAERYRSWRAALCTENRDWMQRVQADMQRKCIASGKGIPSSDEVDRAIDAAMEKQP